MKKQVVTHFKSLPPTPFDNIAAGYNVGQRWVNTLTGIEYFHETDGVWIAYERVGNKKTTLVNDITAVGYPTVNGVRDAVDLLEQVIVSTSQNVQEAWRGKVVIFTSSCTITVPASLSENFAFQGVTSSGVTITWAITAPKTWLFGTPSSTLEKSTFSLLQQGVTNNIILLQ